MIDEAQPPQLFAPLTLNLELHETLMHICASLRGCEEHANTRWFYACSPTPADVPPSSDAFLHHILDWMGRNIGAGRSGFRALRFEKQKLTALQIVNVDPHPLGARLNIAVYDGKLYLLASGDSADAFRPSLAWQQAISYALEEVRKDLPHHKWRAVVSQLDTNWRRWKALPRELRLGKFTIAPESFAYQERITANHIGIGGYTYKCWIPIYVEASTQGYDDQAAFYVAAKEVKTLCNYLSVITGHLWELKNPVRWEHLGRNLPREIGGVLESRETSTIERQSMDEAELSQIECLWDTFEASSDLRQLCDSYYEALCLFDKHPSFSLVGFVTVIEQIGKLIGAQEKIEQCPTCKKPMVNGAKKQFSSAIEAAVDASEVKGIVERLYGWRSGTAHSGKTFYQEKSFGTHFLGGSALVANEKHEYFVRGPLKASEIARDLLLRMLRKDLGNRFRAE